MKSGTTALKTMAGAQLLALLAGMGGAFGQCVSTKLTASDAASFDVFGGGLAMDMTANGPILIAGAQGDDNSEGTSAGAVYVFTKFGSAWTQASKFFPLDLANDYHFGAAVAYEDPYLVVGAPGVDFGALTDSGAFYMYERSGSTWVPKGRYVPQFADNMSVIGSSVSVTTGNGGRALIGAPGMTFDGNGGQPGNQNPEAGAAYLYERLADGTWGYVTMWHDYDSSGSAAYQHLGSSVAISGDMAVVGAPNGEASGKPSGSGYVKVYRRGANSWSSVGAARLSPADAQLQALFGTSVATDGTSIAISAPLYATTAAQTPANGASSGAGCVYVYRWNSATSTLDLDGQMFADDADSFTHLGGNVKIDQGRVYATSYSKHRVYCFKRLGAGNWVQESAFNDPEPGSGSTFATDVAVSGGNVVVGDDGDTRGALISAGAAFAFTSGALGGNDACAGAINVTAGNYTGCTTGATYGIGSSCGAGGANGPGADVWYRWTPACSGNIIIDTIGSSFDTVLSVHSTCPEPGNPHQIACNDDAQNFGLQSLVTFDCDAGTTYFIRVGGYNGASGDFVLRINDYQNVANDTCATALQRGVGSHTFKTCKATSGVLFGSPACTALDMVGDVWFSFIPTASGALTASTCGSTFDTMLQLFQTSCPVSHASSIACNDDAGGCGGGPLTSRITTNVQAGQMYYLRVGGFPSSVGGSVGDGVLNLSLVPTCRCDWNLSGAVTVQDIFDFLAAWFSANGDFNGVGGTTVQDIFDFLACWFAGCN